MFTVFHVSESLPLSTWLVLVGASFFTSMLTAVFGAGGGLTLLALLAQLLPAPAIIPVHAVVQAGSNLGRAALLLRQVKWRFIAVFTTGALAGSLIGGHIAITLPPAMLQGALGAFILAITWAPALPQWAGGAISTAAQGCVSSILTMFVGATGPFIAAALKHQELSPVGQVSTFAAAMALQHVLKIVVFATLGFAFAPYLSVMLAMVVTGFLGTLTGTRVLKKRSAENFGLWLNIILTLLALRLLYAALSAWP